MQVAKARGAEVLITDVFDERLNLQLKWEQQKQLMLKI